MTFSFIDFGQKDFCRNADGTVITVELDSYEQASEFVGTQMQTLDPNWTNTGTRNWCWDEEE